MGYQKSSKDLSLRKHIKNREPIVCHAQKSGWGSKLRPNHDPWTARTTPGDDSLTLVLNSDPGHDQNTCIASGKPT
jgi:hypothetical protein